MIGIVMSMPVMPCNMACTPLRLEPHNFLPQPVNLSPLGLHLPKARKRVLGISAKFLHPSAQHIVVEIKITRSLDNRNPALLHQICRLKLELSALSRQLLCLGGRQPWPWRVVGRRWVS